MKGISRYEIYDERIRENPSPLRNDMGFSAKEKNQTESLC